MRIFTPSLLRRKSYALKFKNFWANPIKIVLLLFQKCGLINFEIMHWAFLKCRITLPLNSNRNSAILKDNLILNLINLCQILLKVLKEKSQALCRTLTYYTFHLITQNWWLSSLIIIYLTIKRDKICSMIGLKWVLKKICSHSSKRMSTASLWTKDSLRFQLSLNLMISLLFW